MNLTKQVTKIITVYSDGSTTTQDFYTSPMPTPNPLCPPVVGPKPGAFPNPWTPKSSPDHPDYKREVPTVDPIVPYWDVKNKCPKCGLVCEGAMGYVCPNGACPMGMGGVTC